MSISGVLPYRHTHTQSKKINKWNKIILKQQCVFNKSEIYISTIRNSAAIGTGDY